MRTLKTVLCVLLGFGGISLAQTALPSPPTRPQFLDNLGHAAGGGFVYTYDTGTSNPEGTWTDFTGTVANNNPVTLDSAGFPLTPGGTAGGNIWLTPSVSYRICLQNSAHVQQYCIDGIAGLLPTTSGGAVTSVTASAPLTSSGGGAPNIAATLTGNGSKIQSSNVASSLNGQVCTYDGLGNTANSSTLLSALALLASPTFSGDPKAPTAATNDNDTSLATTAFVHNQLTSGTQLLGNNTTANTQTASDSSTKLATTAFVHSLSAALDNNFAKAVTSNHASPATAPTTRTLSSTYLNTNGNDVFIVSDASVKDDGGAGPASTAVNMTLNGTSICGCGAAGTNGGNGNTQSCHIEAWIHVVTAGNPGTAKAQCTILQNGPVSSFFGFNNTTDATFSLVTTSNVTIGWACTDDTNNLDCTYFDDRITNLN